MYKLMTLQENLKGKKLDRDERKSVELADQGLLSLVEDLDLGHRLERGEENQDHLIENIIIKVHTINIQDIHQKESMIDETLFRHHYYHLSSLII